jgi:hypothetical protein
MRPFKMFFGMAVGVILFFFVARIVFVAFLIAAAMSIIYAVYRRLKDFVTYDRFGNNYMGRNAHYRTNQNWQNEVEPLFVEHASRVRRPTNNVRIITAI